jgi:ArsR family transcriptional regulator
VAPMPDLISLFNAEFSAEDATRLARTMSALSDPHRLQIVGFLASRGGMVVGDINAALGGLAQPTVSHHLRVLRAAGLVRSEKRGRFVRYWLAIDALVELHQALDPGGVR